MSESFTQLAQQVAAIKSSMNPPTALRHSGVQQSVGSPKVIPCDRPGTQREESVAGARETVGPAISPVCPLRIESLSRWGSLPLGARVPAGHPFRRSRTDRPNVLQTLDVPLAGPQPHPTMTDHGSAHPPDRLGAVGRGADGHVVEHAWDRKRLTPKREAHPRPDRRRRCTSDLPAGRRAHHDG